MHYKALSLKNLSLATLMCALLLPLSSARAQTDSEEPIDTDRPSQGQAASVVPRKMLQLETGIFYQHDQDDTEESQLISYPATAVRIGVLKWAELRVGLRFIDSTTTAAGIETRKNGFGPPSVGTKIHLLDQQGMIPEVAFLGSVTLPVGSKEVRTEKVAPQLRFCLSNALTKKLQLEYNLAYLWDGISDDGTGQYTAALQYELSEKLKVFAEVYGNRQDGSAFEQAGDAGLQFLLLQSLQLDVAAATRLNRHAPDYWLTGGLSLRLPR